MPWVMIKKNGKAAKGTTVAGRPATYFDWEIESMMDKLAKTETRTFRETFSNQVKTWKGRNKPQGLAALDKW